MFLKLCLLPLISNWEPNCNKIRIPHFDIENGQLSGFHFRKITYKPKLLMTLLHHCEEFLKPVN